MDHCTYSNTVTYNNVLYYIQANIANMNQHKLYYYLPIQNHSNQKYMSVYMYKNMYKNMYMSGSVTLEQNL